MDNGGITLGLSNAGRITFHATADIISGELTRHLKRMTQNVGEGKEETGKKRRNKVGGGGCNNRYPPTEENKHFETLLVLFRVSKWGMVKGDQGGGRIQPNEC
jgi:hypothetical protein